MFRKRGIQEDSIKKLEELREMITIQFSKGLKLLQQKHHIDGETIVSNEASNNLCNIIEAVFLHGVKDTILTRITSYAQRSNADVKVNFWGVVQKFTHKDVVQQLKELRQISTDIGRCRAWVRMALNDGLMSSYLSSMLSDPAALSFYYHPWAFLLDYEQPGILENHLTGLSTLTFKLSFNSSVLNTWSITTVMLVGLLQDSSRNDPVNLYEEIPEISLPSMDEVSETVVPVIQCSETFPQITLPQSFSRDVVHTGAVTPPSTPAHPCMFNSSREVEVIKKLTVALNVTSEGSGSSSSVTSCPDPSQHMADTTEHADRTGFMSVRGGSPSNSPSSRTSPFDAYFKIPPEDRRMEEERILQEVLAKYDRIEEEKEKGMKEAKSKENVEENDVQDEGDRGRGRQGTDRHSCPEHRTGLVTRSQKERRSDGFDVQHRHASRRSQMSKPHDREQVVSVASPVQTETEVERICAIPPLPHSPSCGNSLVNLDGWTSMVPCPQEGDQKLEESYESMLTKYQQENSQSMKLTVQDIVDGMEPLPPPPPVQKAEPFVKVYEPEDELEFGDYEIIRSPSQELDGSKVEQLKLLSQPKGLQAQNFTCAESDCMKGIGHFHGPGRLCEFDGKSYCNTCHENQTAYIPAEIVYNWDFKKRKVSKANFEFLQNNIDQPLLDIDELYAGLYSKVVELNAVEMLRVKLTSLRSYMFTCSETTVRMLRDKVWPREHLYNKVHIYSVNDLVEVKSGRMQKFLQEVVDLCIAHVYSCGLCVLKGFICEICKDPKPIFPFETESTVKCQNCKAVYHQKCKRDSVPCPKCLRLAKRGKKISDAFDEDYAYPHW